MNTRTTLASCLFACSILVACGKVDGVGPDIQPTGTMNALFEQNLEIAAQTFTVNASTGGVVTGADGVQLLFGPGSFLTSTGQVVSGAVQVKLVEALHIGDMIRFNKQTVGRYPLDGALALLRSGGQIRVTATQGPSDLVLGPQGMRVNVPTDSPDPNMRIFLAGGMTEDVMIWDPADPIVVDTVGTGWNGQQGPTPFYYQFTAPAFHWINCDYFTGSLNTTVMNATTPSNLPNDSTVVWFAFPSENAVMNTWARSPNVFGSTQGIAPGFTMIVVGLSRNGASYSSAFSTVTVTPNMTIPLTFQPTTLADFETALDGL